MTTSEWISVLALSISSAGFALQARNWFMSGPRLSLSVMADAITIPDDGGGDRLALTVINRGGTIGIEMPHLSRLSWTPTAGG